MDPTRMGMNKTGMQMSPVNAAQLREIADSSTADGAAALSSMREQYLRDARPVGSVPIPGTATGVLRAGVRALTADRLHALIDRIGERLAFERTGTRLYDAVILKCETRDDEAGMIDLSLLKQFRNEEADHFRLLSDAMEELGGDPTAQTPAADVAAVSSMGLMKVAHDPRTSVAQTLEALLSAELIDGDGWDTLIMMTREFGYDEIADRFAQAASQEELHLRHVRQWMQDAVRNTMRM